MRAVLIDPYTRTITEVTFAGGLDELDHLLQVESVDAVRVGDRDILWLGEKELHKAGCPVWRFGDTPEPFAGRGLILGADQEGNDVSTTVPLKKVVAVVQWTDFESTGRFHTGGVAPGDDGGFYGFVIRVASPVLRKRTTKGR